MKESNEFINENKKNNSLLLIIALATLLVAMIGATFAYFTATMSQETELLNFMLQHQQQIL
jgi:predicted ribosomally synthesized peptide with SipW-like signal peptide